MVTDSDMLHKVLNKPHKSCKQAPPETQEPASDEQQARGWCITINNVRPSGTAAPDALEILADYLGRGDCPNNRDDTRSSVFMLTSRAGKPAEPYTNCFVKATAIVHLEQPNRIAPLQGGITLLPKKRRANSHLCGTANGRCYGGGLGGIAKPLFLDPFFSGKKTKRKKYR